MDVPDPGPATAQETVREARDHPAVGWPAKVGFVVYGVVYVVLGWLAIHLAIGDRAGAVSGNGALNQLAQQPLGKVVLWVAVLGFAALVVYEACQAVAGHRDRHGWRRLRSRLGAIGRGTVFAVLGITAARVALGAGGGGGGGTDGYTAQLMQVPLGRLLVAAVGVTVLGYGGYSVFKGVTDRWRRELDVGGRTGPVGSALAVLARAGYAARGVAFGIIGSLFIWAAVTHDADKSGGLDQALLRLRDAPMGPLMLGIVALGLGCYGVFNIAKVRHLREG